MSWHPFVRIKIATQRGDRHWWSTLDNGYRVHKWVAIQTVEDESGALIFQIIFGPVLLCLAAKEATDGWAEL